MRNLSGILVAALALSAVSTLTAQRGRGRPAAPRPGKLTFETLSKAQLVMIAAIEKVTYGPVARSMPPIHTGTVTLKDITVLRGPAQKVPMVCRFAIRRRNRPTFPTGEKLIVTASMKSGNAIIETHSKATQDNIKLARLAVSVPVGWSVAKGGDGEKPVLTSPWSGLGDKAWPKDGMSTDDLPRGSSYTRPKNANSGIRKLAL